MTEFLKRLGFEELRTQPRPLLAEDYIFAPTIPEGRKFNPVYQAIRLNETPLAAMREIHLQSMENHSRVKVTLALCWESSSDALLLLSRFVNSFERRVPEEEVYNTAARDGIGDFGVAWTWDAKRRAGPDVLTFVRFNVFAALTAHDAEPGLLTALAKQMDGELRVKRTTERYVESQGLFSQLRSQRGDALRIPAGGRLDLGEFPADKEGSQFFLTTSGSVNRDPKSPRLWYYRAGAEPGPQEITVYRVGPGILPVKESLRVEVI